MGILISALILGGLLYAIARHEAEMNIARVILVTAGITFAGLMLSFISIPGVGPILLLGVTAWVLYQFCYVSWPKAFLISFLYIVCQVILFLLITQ